jgi:predicted small secreted protein
MRLIIKLSAILLLTGLVTACNTVQGIGRDFEALGRSMGL